MDIYSLMDEYCIYVRKSRADLDAEAHGEGETLARHEKRLLELARKCHYNVTKIYREIVSGETIAARPVVQQVLQEVEEGRWAGVLVVEVERLARGDTIDQGVVAQAFKYSGTKIVTPNKVYDPTNEFDEEYFEFGLFMSRREYKVINRRLMLGRVASVKEGKWIASMAPYGYKRVRVERGKGWTLAPVESEADVVRLIFKLYISGEINGDGYLVHCGTHSLGKRLDRMGIIPPGKAVCWSERTLAKILSNPVYIGKIRWNKRKSKKRIVNNTVKVRYCISDPKDVILVDGLHPAIIDEQTFKKAQELLRRYAPSLPSSKVLSNPLAGVLFCGKCGRHILLTKSSNGMPYLSCRNRVCDNVGSQLYIVEERLLQALSSWVSQYQLEWGQDTKGDQHAITVKQNSKQKSKQELEKLRKQLDSTYDFLEQGIYDTDTFLARSKALAERIAQTEATIKRLSEEIRQEQNNFQRRRSIVPKAKHLLEVYSQLPSAQAKNDMLREVLEKVEYVKLERSRGNGKRDNFELTLFPKLPASDE